MQARQEQQERTEAIIEMLLQRQRSLLQQLSISIGMNRTIAIILATATFVVDRFAPAIGAIGIVLCIVWYFHSSRLRRLLLNVEEQISRGESGKWEEFYIKFRDAEQYSKVLWRLGGFEPVIWVAVCGAGVIIRIFFG